MNTLQRWWRATAIVLMVAFIMGVMLVPQTAYAGTTGNISGTVTDASGKPVADVVITAASASQTGQGTTDAKGFYSVVNLTPDTYTVSFQKQGFQALSVPGVTVFQDQTITVNEKLQTQLKTIASVRSSGASNLVKSNQGSDVYNVTGQQLSAATNPVDTHETLYQYLAITPGVTGTGFPSQPRVRGGQVTDLGYEFDGIPIQDRITGFFTTNLSNIGIGNIEVYTGGLPASGSTNGTGYFNSVVKTGTYPGYTQLALQVSSPEQNQFLTIQRAGGTPDHKFTYYVGFDGVNSQNQYDYGEHTYPNVLMHGYNGPGTVKTRDWVGNFIYRPDTKNAVQFLLTNSLGEFDYNYLLMKDAGEAPALAYHPCPGAVYNANTFTGASGGTSPNGETCPEGLYFTSIPNGGGNMWHHYGGLGKIQWNHNINDHSFFNLRLAENFNQYIFDQPWGDPNIPSWENPGGAYNWYNALLPKGDTAPPGQASGCPTYPMATGSAVQAPVFYNPKTGTTTTDLGDICSWLDGFAESFYGDRRSNMWFGNLDYTNELSANLTVKAGVSHERDQNLMRYYLTNFFQGGTNGAPLQWPNNYWNVFYPTTRDQVYAQTDLHVGKWLLSPGLSYAQEHYGCPVAGCVTQHALNPTFNGTYTFDPRNVVRFSWGTTSSFVGAGYVYHEGSTVYDPNKAGFSYSPQINHSADLMFEHAFNDGTTMRFGPYYNRTDNYFQSYRPIIGNTGGVPIYGPAVFTNGQKHKTFGFELAVNHVDNRPKGVSYWLSGTYDNYWGTSGLSAAFINFPLPQNIIDQGIYVRAFGNPLLQGTLLADFHSDRFHFDPMAVYSTDYFYNAGVYCTKKAGVTVAPYICQNENMAGANWWTRIMAYEELGAQRNYVVGFRVDNLLDNTNDVTPCNSTGTGCYPFNGPQSGITNTFGPIYQNYSQGPRTFYFFAGVKM